MNRIKVLSLELGDPIDDINGLDGYSSLRALLRWHTEPVGYIDVPLRQGMCSATTLKAAIARTQSYKLLQTVTRDELDSIINPAPPADDPDNGTSDSSHRLSVSVAVCTRDRADQLRDCLASLRTLVHPDIEILVVDNAPSTNQTRDLVQEEFPEFHYVLEPRPGLDWARNRAISAASGDILAYTDDDVIVDPQWVGGLMRVFEADANVTAVTGLVAPYELETDAQIMFENYGGFGRGFQRTWYRSAPGYERRATQYIGAGRFGTGANMAFRRSVFNRIGLFDPALDVGTVTNGGGDLEMFFRILEEGHTLVYEPAALVWHRHRKTRQELRTQLTNHGIGFYSYIVRSVMHYPQRRNEIIRFGLWWFFRWDVRRFLKSLIVKPRVPRDMITAELRGALIGLTRYQNARRRAEQIRKEYPEDSGASIPARPVEENLTT